MNHFINKLRSFSDLTCMVCEENHFTYAQLVEQTLLFQTQVMEILPPGSVVAIHSTYSFSCVALLFALALNRNIIIPLSKDSLQKHEEYIGIGKAQYIVGIDEKNNLHVSQISASSCENEFYQQLRVHQHSGLVLFSSGSSGPPKGIVHDLERLLSAYKASGKSWCTLVFLQMDHIGGINTLFYNLSNGGTIVIPCSRMPEDICRCIQTNSVELLPTSPTFLNLIILSEMTLKYDISCLKLITYGTEPMPLGTLKKMRELLPHVRLKQTYGLSETGILQTRSKEDCSLWIKIGSYGCETKIMENRLWIKSDFSMLGYLNADNPFETDGYINTGDLVEQDGDWLKILGRESELINVGGNKVFPAEVEAVLQAMPEVEDAVVYGIESPLTGQMVAAVVKTRVELSLAEFKSLMRNFCHSRLENYKIPVKVVISKENLYSERFKKKRRFN